MNKKGDIQSILFAIVVIAAAGIMLTLLSHIFFNIYTQYEDTLQGIPRFNDSEATRAIADIKAVETNVWDFAFLGIALGYVILVAVFGFQTRTSPFFFWLSVILSILGLFMATALGRVWQGMAAEPALSETIARFPITDLILGSYFPTFATFLIVIGLILLYGKPQGAPGR